jgi:hypothetical protein
LVEPARSLARISNCGRGASISPHGLSPCPNNAIVGLFLITASLRGEFLKPVLEIWSIPRSRISKRMKSLPSLDFGPQGPNLGSRDPKDGAPASAIKGSRIEPKIDPCHPFSICGPWMIQMRALDQIIQERRPIEHRSWSKLIDGS